ncbi:MAG: ACP S-malonyltransferase [Solirubrobacteraceae bacterium]
MSTDHASPGGGRRACLAGLFPGQGSHTQDMRALVEHVLPQLAADCMELVGDDPFARAAESTRYAQPAIFCASIAAWTADRDARRGACEPIAYAGHSLGELAALVAGGALRVGDGLRLAVLRGQLMAAAAELDDDGTMLALLGASAEQGEQLLERHPEAVLANDNAPGQAVLAGPRRTLRSLCADARGEGVRALMLDVAGAFHSPAMAPAVEPFAEALAQTSFDFPAVKVLSCASAAPFIDIRSELAEAIVRPVRWRETMIALATRGADAFVDYGPSTVLAKLVPRNVPDAHALAPSLPDPLAESAVRAA